MKRFLTLFPAAENVHLVKDVGMIPFILHKKFNYDCTLASYKNGDYPYLKNEVCGLKHAFIKKVLNVRVFDSLLFLFKTRNRYDILQVYHLDKNSLLIGLFFKLIHAKKVKVYLKLDANDLVKKRKESKLKKYIYNFLLSGFDLVSAETTQIQEFLSNRFNADIKYIPNGFYDNNQRQKVLYEEKENIILTVGRIGAYVKATEILCEGFKIFAQSDKEWKLEIVGPVDPSFENYIRNYFEINPELKARVKFIGLITDREELIKYYRRAKVFVLPSRWESFGLVFLEAAKAGCYIISTDIAPAHDVTNNGELGSIFPIDDYWELSQNLKDITGNPEKIKKVCGDIQEYAYNQFYWPSSCCKIDYYLNKSDKN